MSDATPAPGGRAPVPGSSGPSTDPRLALERITADGADPGRWMLVLHGIYGAGRNWASVARRFVRARPEWGALLVDLREHGDSTGFPPSHTVHACAADILRSVRDQAIDAEAILGHSFGGKVALLYAEAARAAEGGSSAGTKTTAGAKGNGAAVPTPRRVWVIDSTPDARPPGGSAWEMLRVLRVHPGPFADRGEAVAAVEAEGFPTPVAQWMSTNVVRQEHGDGWTWRLDPDAMEALLRSFFETDTWAAIESAPAGTEVHVVKAEESSVLDQEACARIEAANRARLHRVPGGHWVNADAPDALHALLMEHMD